MGPVGRARLGSLAGPTRDARVASRARAWIEQQLADFPYELRFRDWTGASYCAGRRQPHWRGGALEVALHTPRAARRILAMDAMGFLECHLRGEADLEGNLYLVPEVRLRTGFGLTALRALLHWIANRSFQTVARARLNVKSHYDVPQEALETYLDRRYLSYSCGMFERPELRDPAELLRVGRGEPDDFDSLEKAQWRKFRDAIDFIAPAAGDTLLDVGCGYGGQLRVALESHAFRRYVGWTHSANQVARGRALLADQDPARFSLREGDYREDDAVYDHVTSTGMISHVGPRGLAPYVREIRRRIRPGGRYLHHALMRVWEPVPLDFEIGPAFNKRFVWPGFHWFTLGEHVRALERNGFEVLGARNLSLHYAKTTAAWYERMMQGEETMRAALGEPTLRAWRLYLAGSCGSFLAGGIHVHRLYCRAL